MSQGFSLGVDGFELVASVLDPPAIDALTSAVSSLAGEAAVHRRGAGSYGARNLLRRCPEVASLATGPALRALVTPVLGEGAFPVRGLFFDKLPGANWEVGWHQDLSIAVAERVEVPGFGGWSIKKGVLHVQPPASVLENLLTLRVHLDDCGRDNGPLRVIRGSHRHGRLKDAEIERWRQDGDEISCHVARGGVMLMRPLLLHASSPATNPFHRRVIHLEYASQSLPGGLRWFEQAG